MIGHRARPVRIRTLIAFTFGLLLVCSSPGARADDEECLECHAVGADLVELDDARRIDPESWMTSVHAEMDFSCTDCHEGIEDYPHDEDVEQARCATCHDEIPSQITDSIHGKLMTEGLESSPLSGQDPCGVCHGIHEVRAIDDPESQVYFRNIPKLCGTCHGDLAIVEERGLSAAPALNYGESVHGLGLKDEDSRPAVCTSCHGAHHVVGASDPESPINPFNIAETCGQCHPEESTDYTSSVHGQAFRRGVSASPTCTDCHGIHTIKMVHHEDGTPQEQRLVRSTCTACHSSEALMGEYGVRAERVETYRASYHGLANKRGNTAVADCASCHGVHAIFPSSDPRSTIAPVNLTATCGSCHPGAGEQFSRNPVHYSETGEQTLDVVISSWVRKAYWVLIILVIGGMIAHNVVILSYYIRRRIRRERHMKTRTRFSRSQTAQHIWLFTSFGILVFSGFMLAYPDTWWARLFADVGISESIRRWTHRIAAILLVITSFYHVWWLMASGYGRSELKRIAPGQRDMREVIQNMRFHLRLSNEPASFGKYDYPAKAEYWALIWGTVVMAITGLILWFPVIATTFLPYWIVKVSQVIHLFEAWLATLAILVFHFFYVIAHPEIYPINLAMFGGKMPEETARHHHPGWDPDEANLDSEL